MTRAGRTRLTAIPSLISALRLPIAAAFFAVDALFWRAVLLFIGAVTDALDGWVARRFSLQSPTGAWLDPMFDKLFVTVALAAFVSGPFLGWGEFAVLLSRDLYVGIGFLAAKTLGVAVPAQSRASGKLVTFLQIVTLFVLLLAPDRVNVFVVAVGVAAAIAMADYTAAGLRAVRGRVRDV